MSEHVIDLSRIPEHGSERLNAVVEFLRSLVDYEEGDGISNLKLQKLLYLCQGWSLAERDAALFEEDFKAWLHGPVIPAIYQRFKEHGWGPIPPQAPIAVDPDEHLSEAERELVEMVWRNYGHMEAKDLEYLTHADKPWLDARATGTKSPTIPRESIASCFRAKLDEVADVEEG